MKVCPSDPKWLQKIGEENGREERRREVCNSVIMILAVTVMISTVVSQQIALVPEKCCDSASALTLGSEKCFRGL